MATKKNARRARAAALIGPAVAALMVSSNARGVTVNLTFDSSVTSNVNSTSIQNACNYVALQFKNLYTDAMNVNITVVAGTSGLGGSNTSITGLDTYATMRTRLSNKSSGTNDAAAIASLPATSPLPAGSSMVYTRAQAKVLGFIGDDLTNDGTYTFNANQTYTFDPANRTAAGKFDFISVTAHEFSEIMGRIPALGTNFFGQADYLPYDLFRWSAPGTRGLNNGAGNYFSIDSGTTNLKNYNNAALNGGDSQDWASGTNDAYNAFTSSGVMNLLTPVDVTAVDVIGYTVGNVTWTGTADHTTWDIFNNSNWSNSAGSTKYTDAALLVFNDTSSAANNSVTLNQTVFPSSVTVSSSTNNFTFSGSGAIAGQASLTKSGSSTLTLATLNNFTGGTTVNAGTLRITSPGATGTGAGPVSVTGGKLEMAAAGSRVLVATTVAVTGGSIDLQDNKLIAKSASVGTWNGTNYTGVTGLIKSGRNNGTWNGVGILTSQSNALAINSLTTLAVATASDVGKSTFGGVSVAGTDVLVMYTYAGDANLSGAVTGDDYFRIDTGFANSLKGFSNGDFNYDGKINADDYFLIDRSYAHQGAAFSAGPLPEGISAVPEPSSIAMLALSVAALGKRCRGRQ